jgi:hypothetical protein
MTMAFVERDACERSGVPTRLAPRAVFPGANAVSAGCTRLYTALSSSCLPKHTSSAKQRRKVNRQAPG